MDCAHTKFVWSYVTHVMVNYEKKMIMFKNRRYKRDEQL